MKPSSKYKEKSKKQEKQEKTERQDKKDKQKEPQIQKENRKSKSPSQSNDKIKSNQVNQQSIFNTEIILKEHIVKYQTFRPFIEEIMREDISKIVTVLEDLYEICIKLYETEEEENYEDYSFDLFCLIEELKIDKRDDNEIIKLMYILSFSLDKSIEYHNEKFYEDYSNHEKLKVSLINEISSIQTGSYSNSIGNPCVSSNVSSLISSVSNSNEYFSLLISSGLKGVKLSKEEVKIIEKLTKETCFEVIDDLFTYFLFISRFLEQVTLSFSNLIVRFNLLIGEDKNLNKIFLEEYSVLILKDVLFKVSKSFFLYICLYVYMIFI